MVFRLYEQDLFRARPRAIIFDLDDTLYDYAHAHGHAIAAVRNKVHETLKVSSSAFETTFHAARQDIKQKLGPTASSHSRLLYFQRTVELLDFKSQPMLALDLEQTYWRTFLVNAELFPNAVDVLIELRALGFPIALTTDLTAQIQFRKLIYFNVDRYFDAIITSEEVGGDKSTLKPFLLTMEKLGLQPNEPVWVIGDDECDIVTCHKALPGARSLQKLHGTKKLLPNAAASFETFKELWNALKEVPDV
jgi:FMN phosphatase YigB (HAD superfamily)